MRLAAAGSCQQCLRVRQLGIACSPLSRVGGRPTPFARVPSSASSGAKGPPQQALGASPLPSHTNRPFPRGTVNRSTFHSGQTRRAYNGPGGLPAQSQDTSSVSGRQSFFSKLSSKFSKRFQRAPGPWNQ
ncbi:hypothetical protein HPB47_009784 [Ixodes persulcatus]|uniref:Uncharacterized protein n=1 Tax=Ixodes persulcatus TaxID=34615 RepID=A0AC60P187_IXOPE|nr:hypothetical protein HPB47_009784 [Ixodes persulcatus]